MRFPSVPFPPVLLERLPVAPVIIPLSPRLSLATFSALDGLPKSSSVRPLTFGLAGRLAARHHPAMPEISIIQAPHSLAPARAVEQCIGACRVISLI